MLVTEVGIILPLIVCIRVRVTCNFRTEFVRDELTVEIDRWFFW